MDGEGEEMEKEKMKEKEKKEETKKEWDLTEACRWLACVKTGDAQWR